MINNRVDFEPCKINNKKHVLTAYKQAGLGMHRFETSVTYLQRRKKELVPGSSLL